MRAVGYPAARIYFVASSKISATMTNVVLFDDPILKTDLLPFTFTRPVSEIRCGILTLTEKWEMELQGNYSYLTTPYLKDKYPLTLSSDNLYINGSLIPTEELLTAIAGLQPDDALYAADDQLLAIRTPEEWHPEDKTGNFNACVFEKNIVQIAKKWHIHQLNGGQIAMDLQRLKKKITFVPLSDPFTHCYHPDNIFIEERAVIRASVLNATDGPIYIGKGAVVQEGSSIQGPFAMGEGAVLAQGSKIRPNTTVGPFCKVGGEVNNSVFFANSNKGHDGYLGNSIVGEWCNLGANTNNSNLKNDYSNVRLFSYTTGELEDTGLANCGLYMGDYSKSGINTMFNTGTVVGVHANVFGAGFQDKHIPSFSWGGKAEGYSPYRLDKALLVAHKTAQSKNRIFTETETKILEEVHKSSVHFRIQ